MSLRKNRVLKLNILLLVLAMACLFYYDSQGGLVLKGLSFWKSAAKLVQGERKNKFYLSFFRTEA